MKRKLLSILTLLLAVCSGAWATSYIPTKVKKITATGNYLFSDISTAISENWAVYAGAATLPATTNKNVTVTDTDFGITETLSGPNTIQVKTDGNVFNSNKRVVHFLVTNVTGVKAIGQANDGRGFQIGATEYTNETTENTTMNVVAGNSTATNPVSHTGLDASKTYIISIFAYNSDTFLYGVRFTAAALTKPEITSSPVSARYAKDDEATALTVTATASSGSLHYQWYKNSSASTDGAMTVGTDSPSYTPPTDAAGTTYYYCVPIDDNGEGNPSDFAEIYVAEARGVNTWDFGSLTASDISANTTYWQVNAGDANRYDNKVAYAANEEIMLENAYRLDLANGIRFYRTAALSAGNVRMFIGKGIYVNGGTSTHVTIPATVGSYYRITHARSQSGECGFSISSGAELVSGDMAYTFSNNNERPTFILRATATTIDLASLANQFVLNKVEEVVNLNGAWSKSSDEFNKGAIAPDAPTFTVTAADGSSITKDTDYSVTYSLKDGSTEGIVTFTADGGITAISNATAGEATIIATVASLNSDYIVTTSTYEYTVTVTTKTITPVISQSFNTITITCETDGSDIYYTTDGTDPTTSSTAYTAPFALTEDCTVKAIAVTDGFTDSDIASFSGEYLAIASTTTFKFNDTGWQNQTLQTKDGVTVGAGCRLATSGTIYADGLTLPTRFQFGGGSRTDTRYISFKVQAPCNIIIYDASNSNGNLRGFGISTGTYTTTCPIQEVGKNVGGYGDVVYYAVTGSDITTVNFSPDGNNDCCIYGFKVVYNNENSYTTSIGATGYATLALPYAVTIPSGITAYTGAVNGAGTGVTLTAIEDGIIPANTGVIIKGKEDSYTFTETTTPGTAVSGLGNSAAGDSYVIISSSDTFYVLAANGSGNAVFAEVADNATYKVVPSNKAYVQIPSGSQARSLTLDFDEPTGIKTIDNELSTVDNYYNLNGQRVDRPTKGLYIVNGKKVIIK